MSKKPPLQNQGFKWWEHVTEIWAVATNIYIEGTFPNGVQYDMASAIQLMHNMMVAHAKAVIAYKEAGYEGKIGIVHSLESKYPYDKTKDEDVKAAKNEDVLNNQFLLDATFLRKIDLIDQNLDKVFRTDSFVRSNWRPKRHNCSCPSIYKISGCI